MKHIIENETLTIYLKGELNSSNSEEVEKEIEAILSKKGFKSIVFDLKELDYISSAGLRILVRVKQKYDETRIVNVPKGVRDIFDMVGFSNLFDIN